MNIKMELNYLGCADVSAISQGPMGGKNPKANPDTCRTDKIGIHYVKWHGQVNN